MSDNLSFELATLKLLGLGDILPEPLGRFEAADGYSCLTEADIARAEILVCERLPSVSAREWSAASIERRTEWVRRAESKGANHVDDSTGESGGRTVSLGGRFYFVDDEEPAPMAGDSAETRGQESGEFQGGETANGGQAKLNPTTEMESGHQSPGTPNPKEYLRSWAEILDALDLKNNRTNKDRVRNTNKNFEGPIILPAQGGQPKVAKAGLLSWWNGLEKRFRDEAGERSAGLSDHSATVFNQYEQGRGEHSETVVPDISGHVKHRRGGST